MNRLLCLARHTNHMANLPTLGWSDHTELFLQVPQPWRHLRKPVLRRCETARLHHRGREKHTEWAGLVSRPV
jgi:hypothetical protein